MQLVLLVTSIIIFNSYFFIFLVSLGITCVLFFMSSMLFWANVVNAAVLCVQCGIQFQYNTHMHYYTRIHYYTNIRYYTHLYYYTHIALVSLSHYTNYTALFTTLYYTQVHSFMSATAYCSEELTRHYGS